MVKLEGKHGSEHSQGRDVVRVCSRFWLGTALLKGPVVSQEAEQFEVLADAVLDSLPAAAFRTDLEGRVAHANAEAERLFKLNRSDVVGSRYDQPVTDIFGPDGGPIEFDRSPVPLALQGRHVRGFEALVRIGSELLTICFDASPLKHPSGSTVGAIVSARNITAQKDAEAALTVSQRRLDAVLNNTRMAVFVMDADQRCTFANTAAEQLTGYSFAEMQGRALHDVIHHTRPDGSHYPLHECPIDRAFPENYQVEGEEIFVHKDGSFYPVAFTASPIRDEASQTVGTVIEARGLAADRAVQAELEDKSGALQEQTNALSLLNRTSAAISGDLDLERVVQTVVAAAVELTRAEFGAFFYNVMDEAGARYTLYTIAGAPREAFSKFPMPRATAVFKPTFEGSGVIRSDDIMQDPRYGKSAPYHGMPEGHLPVRSYLAVPVRSRSGEVLGGLFFGHSRPAVFHALDEERVVGLASQAAIAIDNARLFQSAERELAERRRAESELQALNSSLEARVAEEVQQRTKAEHALRQAQKMEAIGQLTGGVAHDFNNLLTVIMGGLDTIRRSKPTDTARIQRAAEMAMKGAHRAASLTSRLLAFSRRQPLAPTRVELNAIVRDMTELLHRTLGEQVELEGILAPRLWPVEVDQNQLESALLNLAVNARDAMSEGGKLTIETTNTVLDDGYAAVDAEVVPGQYVMVSVSDTGSGMDADTVSKAFEPFFTTKEVGRGTGLGLSMVYGFVKQSGGHVTIYSEEGQGTTVKLYFPRQYGDARPGEEQDRQIIPLGSEGEVVLLVEDNDEVRAYSSMVLEELGYRVIAAAEAEAAIEVLRGDQVVDLLFTDVVLPGKSGRVLADTALEIRPGLKVLYTTGYSRNAIVHHGRLDAGVELIGKPFTFEELAAKVRDVLDKA